MGGAIVPAAFKRQYPRAERGKNSPFCSVLLTPKNPQEFFQTKIETCKTTKHSNGFTQQEKRNIDAVITGLDKGSRIHIELIFYEIGNKERKAAEKQQ